MIQLQALGASDIGNSRSNNEDVWAAMPEFGFFALADGMGGHNAGEVAAQLTIDSLSAIAKKLQGKDVMELIIELRHAIEKINQQVFEASAKNLNYEKMGTTLCCLLWTSEAVVYAHVGDSRIYRLRKEKLSLLTQDHSLMTKWLATGKLAEECETPYPYKHVLTRSIGGPNKANPEISVAIHQEDDLFFLCSDGISDALTLEEMESILNTTSNLKEASNLFIQTAKNKGSSDNMTVVMVSNAKNLS